MKWSQTDDWGTPGGAIATQYGNSGFVGQINQLHWQCGAELCAFNLAGMILKLEGEANDYVGKGCMVVKLLSP